MVKDDQTNQNVLPYGTTSDNIIKLLNSIKNKEGDEKGIKAIYSGTKYESTQSALEALGIIYGVNLTDIGRRLAFESDVNVKENIYLEIILMYPPYELFLEYIKQDSPTETVIENLKNFWGKNNYGASPNNRSEAAPVCFSFFELAGLGKYILGRRGKNTRFEWEKNLSNRIQQTQQNGDQKITDFPNSDKSILSKDGMSQINEKETKCPVVGGMKNIPESERSGKDRHYSHSIVPASFDIKVDITEWDLDKISALFRIINNKFEEN